jgi:sec-independent protein translocase protein TatC
MQERVAPPNDDNGQKDIDDSKAPLIEHLIELRTRLMWALAAFVAMFFFCFAVAGKIYNVLVWPYMWASGSDQVKLIATHFLEQILTQVKLAMFGAGFLSFPVVATQIYKFVAPGLYKNERRAFLPYLVATPILFVIGAAVVYFIAMPVLIKFSIGLTQMGGEGVPTIELLPKVSEYLSLIMTLIFGFGIVFQLPVILTLLARAGIITSDGLVDARRYAIVGIFAVAAVLTPPDALSMVIMALPTVLLYEASIYAVRFVEKRQPKTPAI